jgi:hypothetical protein
MTDAQLELYAESFGIPEEQWQALLKLETAFAAEVAYFKYDKFTRQQLEKAKYHAEETIKRNENVAYVCIATGELRTINHLLSHKQNDKGAGNERVNT